MPERNTSSVKTKKNKAKPLIIVESPTKARTISRFMKSRYEVKASLGHIRDLPKSQLGVDIENGFQPKYISIRGKGDVIKQIKAAAQKASKVYLATDPDREGEAISWHLCSILGIDPQRALRVIFHEITEKAVKNAFADPGPIRQGLVDAQQARRILDRLVGYSLSPLLWKKIRPGLSAGRVQSAALRILVDREEQIEGFVPEEYWTINANLRGSKGTVKAKYYGVNGEKKELKQKEDVEKVLKDVSDASFVVKSVVQKERVKNPPPPFTTSTLQQEASRKLGFPVRKTMMVAQSLYEGVEMGKSGYQGLITYMRTDSTRVAPDAAVQAKEYIKKTFGDQYAGNNRRNHQQSREQGAHEAIRPTGILWTPNTIKQHLKPDQYKLYKLIWERFIASNMAPALYHTVTCEISANKHIFRATGSRLKFAGFTVVYEESQDSPADDEKDIIPLVEGEKLQLLKLEPLQHFTEPLPRFTEAMLVKVLEENGIGRPSTYAPIISTLAQRDYVRREKRRLYPTELGRLVDSLLRENFPSIVDVKFTAEMEKKLDAVEEGDKSWTGLLEEFWASFKILVEKAEKEVSRMKVQDESAGIDCDECGRPMVIKRSRFGKFIACSGYPGCRNTKPIAEKAGVSCPLCNGDILVRRSKRGRVFYGCQNYPQCKYVTWHRPLPDKKCPKCGAFVVETGNKAKKYKCASEQCDYTAEKI